MTDGVIFGASSISRVNNLENDGVTVNAIYTAVAT